MSRTYRKPDGYDNIPHWVTHDYKRAQVPYRTRWQTCKRKCREPYEYYVWQWTWVKKEGKDLKRAIAKYHGDGSHNWKKAPSHFRNTYCTRPTRRQNKAECKRLILAEDHEDYNFVDSNKGVDWDWY